MDVQCPVHCVHVDCCNTFSYCNIRRYTVDTCMDEYIWVPLLQYRPILRYGHTRVWPYTGIAIHSYIHVFHVYLAATPNNNSFSPIPVHVYYYSIPQYEAPVSPGWKRELCTIWEVVLGLAGKVHQSLDKKNELFFGLKLQQLMSGDEFAPSTIQKLVGNSGNFFVVPIHVLQSLGSN